MRLKTEEGREKMADAFFYADKWETGFRFRQTELLSKWGLTWVIALYLGSFNTVCDLAWGQWCRGLGENRARRMSPLTPTPWPLSLFTECQQDVVSYPVGQSDLAALASGRANIRLQVTQRKHRLCLHWSGTLTHWWPGFELVTSRWMALYLITNSPEPPGSSSHQEQEDLLRVGAEVQPGALNPSTELLPQL